MDNVSLRYGVDLGNKVVLVDTGFLRPQFASSYIISQRAPSGNRLAIIDPGTNFSVPRILATIKDLACDYDQVSYIILTHIQLDMSSGVGLLMQYCPNAKLIVHARGARHMIDPSNLLANAIAIYGESYVEKEFGKLLPVNAKRVIEISEGCLINLAGRIMTILETSGHSKEHICIWDELTQGIFTGDTFGLSFREFHTPQGPFVFPSTPAVNFDPKGLRVSLKKIMALNPNCLYLTHFGRVDSVTKIYEGMIKILDEIEKLGKKLKSAQNRHDYLKEGLLNVYIETLRNLDCQLGESKIQQLLEFDIEQNALGMGVWLD